jgi:hypothetical protein
MAWPSGTSRAYYGKRMHRRKNGFVEGQRKAASSGRNWRLSEVTKPGKLRRRCFSRAPCNRLPPSRRRSKNQPNEAHPAQFAQTHHSTSNPPAYFFYPPQIEF